MVAAYEIVEVYEQRRALDGIKLTLRQAYLTVAWFFCRGLLMDVW